MALPPQMNPSNFPVTCRVSACSSRAGFSLQDAAGDALGTGRAITSAGGVYGIFRLRLFPHLLVQLGIPEKSE